jgi:hypothetical protein
MNNLHQRNLDYLAARYAQQVIQDAQGSPSKVDNTVTKALGVLQENGVYACFLYLLASEKKNGCAVIHEMLALLEALEFPKPPPANDSSEKILRYIVEKVTQDDLPRLLLAKETLERMLIYARYGAKARDAQK